MTGSHQERQSQSARLWRRVTVCGGGVFVILGLVFLVAGRANADEGWYLYAGRLVFEGEVPYRDFAYTQTPLLPYVYGLPQILIGPSMYLGRITSFLLSVANLSLCILLARRYSGHMAAGLTALLFATFTYGIYFGVIVKTYALVSLLFTLTFVVISSRLRESIKYPLAAVVALLPATVRLSAIVFSLVIITYCLINARSRPRSIILALCGIIVVVTVLFTARHSHVVRWNLLGHHLAQWGQATLGERIRHILFGRIPAVMVFFLSYLLLGTSVASVIVCRPVIRRKAERYVGRHRSLVFVSLGLILFASAHLTTGGFHAEYFVPAISSLFPIISVAYVGALRSLGAGRSEDATHRQSHGWAKKLLHELFALSLVLVPVRHTAALVDLSGGELPISEIRQVSQYVADNTEVSDSILALEALWVSIEADRAALPGLTMAQFSYQDISKEEAQALKMVNGNLILQYIKHGTAEAIILTDLDLEMLRNSGVAHSIQQTLSNRYELALVRENFGQRAGEAYVYLRDR